MTTHRSTKQLLPSTLLALLLVPSLCACSGGTASSGTITPPPPVTVAAPTIAAQPSQNGAVIVSLTTTAGTTVYYTTDGSTPTSASPIYQAPFLVAANLTVKAVASASGALSTVASQSYSPNIPPGTLVWSDEFSNSGSAAAAPNPATWSYDTGNSGWGNHELENYCAWNSSASPCDPTQPNAYVGTDGYLHLVARSLGNGVYTSARLKSQGLFSWQYGRVEARIQLPEGQGFWPAFWMLGNNIATVNWPACGEMDIAERVNAAKIPDWNEGSVHGTGFIGSTGLGTIYNFPAGETAAGWHTYGMIWSKNTVAYYIDDPTHPYVTYTNPASIGSFPGAVWPFDAGQSSFFILNLAVGGDWPGSPDNTTTFPAEILVDSIRIYTN